MPVPVLRQRYETLVVALDYRLHLLLQSTERQEVEITAGGGERQGDTVAFGWQRSFEMARAALHYFGLRERVALHLTTEMPPRAGLAIHAAVIAAAVKGLALWSGLKLNPPQVAAIAVEIARAGGVEATPHIYASAFGGIHHLRYEPGREGRSARVKMDALEEATPSLLERWGLLVLPPAAAIRGPIAPLWQSVRSAACRHRRNQRRVAALQAAWSAGRADEVAAIIGAIGGLDEAAFIDPPLLGTAYRMTRGEGVRGGFLVQDGIGCALLLLAPPEKHPAVRQRLQTLGVQIAPLRLARRSPRAFAVEPWRRKRPARRGFSAFIGS